MILGNNLSDNKWHEVKIDRNQRQVTLMVDKLRNQTTTPGSFISLDLDRFLYIGGLDRGAASDDDGLTDVPNLIGCMKDLYLDQRDLLFGAKEDLFDYKTHGIVRFNCSTSEYIPVNFPKPDTHLKLSKHSPENFTVDFNFRTYHGNGVLVYKQSSNALVYLKLVSGNLKLEIRIGNEEPFKIGEGEDLNDGMWHHLTAGVNRKALWLQLDAKPEIRHEYPRLSKIGHFRHRVYIGYGTQNAGFVGCMHQIKLNGDLVNLINLGGSRIKGAVINRCNISSMCFPNPCRNGGQCLQTWRAYSCDCEGTFYYGAHCEIPLYRANCQEYKELGMIEDAHCQVDPDRTGPLGTFTVLCNMSASNVAMTVVSHNKQDKHKVDKDAKSLAGHYFQRIVYGSNLASIRALIERSGSCRQFIKYDCYNSKLLNSPVGPAHVQWLSSTHVPQNYWGDAPAGSNKCACGVTNNCEDPSKYCNCDAKSDNRWREDSGELLRERLPLIFRQILSY